MPRTSLSVVKRTVARCRKRFYRAPFKKDESNCGSRRGPHTTCTTVIACLSGDINLVVGRLGRGNLCSRAVVIFASSGKIRSRKKRSPSCFSDGNPFENRGESLCRKNVHAPFIVR